MLDIRKARTETIETIEKMRVAKLATIPENYKELIFNSYEKLLTLEGIENISTASITRVLSDVLKNSLDVSKKHFYFFVQNDKHTGKSLRYGWQYQGKIFVAKSKLGVKDVRAVLVHEKDKITKKFVGGNLEIDHEPTFEGSIVGGYCVVEYVDGLFSARYYTKKEMDKRREASKNPNSHFWRWEREMYEKTLINATMERILETSPDVSMSGEFYENDQKNEPFIDAEIIPQAEPTAPTNAQLQQTFEQPQQQTFQL